MDAIISELTWIDWTALAVLAYFLVSGLFHGFLWQASRLLSFVLAYLLAGVFARDVAGLLESWFGGLEGVSIYLAYFVIFLVVLIALSLVARVLDRFVKELDLSFYNHLGGGLLGAATAAALLVAVLGFVYRLLPENSVVAKVKESHTGRIARYLVDRAGLPEEIRRLYQADQEPSGQGEPAKEPARGK